MSKISSFILKNFKISSQKKYGRQNKDIETKQAILSAIVESSDDAIISKNLEGIITSWNFGARKIFGYTEAEAIGKSIKMLIPEDRLVEEDHILGNIRSGKKVSHFQTWRIHKSGKEIPISITVSPVKDRRGTIIGASKIARDITEQVQAQYALKRNAENLETLNSIGKKISEKLDAASILQHVTDATTKITGASFGVFIYNIKEEDPQKSKFYVSGSYSRMEKADFVWKLDSALDLQIDQENKIINIHNSAKAIENKKLHELFPAIKNYLVVPIISGSNELLGRLVFGHYNATAFTLEHASLVESIALQAAVALENSKLFEEIKGLNTKKDEFIALASHELKTPLTTIKGYLQLLNKKLAQSKDAIFVEKTLNQVEKLRILVDELLDVSKIEAEKLELNLELFNMKELVVDVVESFAYSNKTHKVILNYSEDYFNVNADKHRLEQVLINLIGNAIKYSPSSDEVYVNVKRVDNQLLVSVKDSGIGLTEVQKEKIFNRFYRVDAVKNISGLGLGLYLTKEIINRHHGTIGVNSELGRGSEFYFSLPLA